MHILTIRYERKNITIPKIAQKNEAKNNPNIPFQILNLHQEIMTSVISNIIIPTFICIDTMVLVLLSRYIFDLMKDMCMDKRSRILAYSNTQNILFH